MSKRLALLGLAVLMPWSQAAAAPDLRQVIPEEAGMVLVLDVPALRQGGSDLPFMELLENPALSRLVSQAFAVPQESGEDGAGSVFEHMMADIEDTSGMKMAEILDLLSGQVALALTRVGDIAVDESQERDPEYLLLAEYQGEPGDLWRALTDPATGSEDRPADVQHRIAVEEIDGINLHTWEEVTESGVTEKEGWAEVDGVAVMSNSRVLLRRAVTALRRGAEDRPFAETAGYGPIAARLGVSDALLYMNAPEFVRLVTWDMDMDEPIPDAFGLTPRRILEALGVYAIEALYASARVAVSPVRVDYGMVYREPAGLLAAFALGGPATARPEMVPADAIQAGVTSWDWMATYRAIHDTLAALSPSLADGLDAQIQQIQAPLEIDLVDALLGSLGPETVSAAYASVPAAPGATPSLETMQRLVAISVTDRQSVAMGLSALQSLAGPGVELFEIEPYLGTDIHVSKTALAPQGETLAYALTESWLLMGVGGADPVRRALAQLREPGPSIWQQADVTAALAALPEGAGGIAYEDMVAMVRGWLGSLFQNQQPEGGGTTVTSEDLPGARDLERAFGAAVSGAYRDERGIHITILIMPPAS